MGRVHGDSQNKTVTMKLFYFGLLVTVFSNVESKKKNCQAPKMGGVAMCELNIDSLPEDALAALNANLPECCPRYECAEIDNTGNKFCVESNTPRAKSGEACSSKMELDAKKDFGARKMFV